MQNKILGVAGCAALMFGLIACSGEDGKDGVNGTNGLNGTSCEVKSLKTGDGYKVLCGGDSVGVLLNGKKGATGDQGIPGAQGKEGKTGKTGASCYVEAVTNGYDVYCGSEKVGQLKNGVAGESCTTEKATDGILVKCAGEDPVKISNGVSCEAKAYSKEGRDGLQVTCGDDVHYLWNGEAGDDCSAKEITDPDTDKKGISVYCADKLVGTVWNGDDGANCVSEDKGDGTVEVTCGDAKPVKIYKAMCGDQVYDPADKFCVLTTLVDKCGTGSKKVAYNIASEYCEKGNVVPMCIDVKFASESDAEVVGASMRAPKSDEFCWNGFITKKCDGKEFDDFHYCGKKNVDKTKDSLKTYCTRDIEITGLIMDLESTRLTQESSDEEVNEFTNINNILAGLGATPYYDVEDLKVFFKGLEKFKVKSSQFCETFNKKEYYVRNKCGEKTFSTKEQFCDRRDNRLYKMVEVGDLVWMAENLAFEYKLPIMEGTGAQARIKIGGTTVSFGKDAYENYANKENPEAGRYYTWDAANGARDDRSSITSYIDANDELQSHNLVVGACPEGWRLPTASELQTLVDEGALLKSFGVNASGYYDVTFVKDPESGEETDEIESVEFLTSTAEDAYLWSVTDNDSEAGISAGGKKAMALMYPHDESVLKTTISPYSKKYALPIRCVQDTRN